MQMANIDVNRIASKNFGVQKTEKYSNDFTVAEGLVAQNNALKELEKLKITSINTVKQQLVIISYVPRSGSTLLSQILSSSGNFNYISNFQARYWLAPYIGGKIEQSLNIRFNNISDYQSDYGRTRMVYDPSEFNYFWENWFEFTNDSSHEVETLSEYNKKELKNQILAIMTLENKPLFFKKEWLGMNAHIILDLFPDAKIIHIERDIKKTVQSMLKARKDIFGDENKWFGAKPKEYKKLLNLNPSEQVKEQIVLINERLRFHEKNNKNQFMFLHHEDIIENPKSVIKNISSFLNMNICLDHCPSTFNL